MESWNPKDHVIVHPLKIKSSDSVTKKATKFIFPTKSRLRWLVQIFLEPESRTNPELYVQGFSTGLPETMQLAMLQTLRGLEKVNPKPFTNWTRGQG